MVSARVFGEKIVSTPAEIAEPLKQINSVCSRLHSYSVNYLFNKRLRSGTLPFHKNPLPLASIITRSIENNIFFIRSRELKLVQEIPTGLQINADAELIALLFSNLINNAAKYATAGGSISIKAKAEGEGCLVEITNPIDLHPVQSGQSTGLGLGICRQIVEKHGGSFVVNNSGERFGVVATIPQH